MVQQAIETDLCSHSFVAGLVEELKSLVESDLLSFQCVFGPRSCNRAPHELAALGLCCVDGEEHITCDVPENIIVIVTDDMSANIN
jgi:hypothetical protein